jgi:hypothetical protein
MKSKIVFTIFIWMNLKNKELQSWKKNKELDFLNDTLPYGLLCVLLPELLWGNGFRQYRKH